MTLFTSTDVSFPTKVIDAMTFSNPYQLLIFNKFIIQMIKRLQSYSFNLIASETSSPSELNAPMSIYIYIVRPAFWSHGRCQM